METVLVVEKICLRMHAPVWKKSIEFVSAELLDYMITKLCVKFSLQIIQSGRYAA